MPKLCFVPRFDITKRFCETKWDFLSRQEAALNEEIERQKKIFPLSEETISKLKSELDKVDKKMKILDTGYATFGDLRDLHDLGDIQIERSRDQRLEDWEDEDDVGSEHSEGTEPKDLDGEVQVDTDDIEALLYPTFASIIYDNKNKTYNVTLYCETLFNRPIRFWVDKRDQCNSETKVEDNDL